MHLINVARTAIPLNLFSARSQSQFSITPRRGRDEEWTCNIITGEILFDENDRGYRCIIMNQLHAEA